MELLLEGTSTASVDHAELSAIEVARSRIRFARLDMRIEGVG